ncbi:MAG: hypothetical protein IPK82_28085 [Polyangiaceae bacterium]|nr:hypothetical protein [Polyangiaceae bacterium]
MGADKKQRQTTGYALAEKVAVLTLECDVCGGRLDATGKCTRWGQVLIAAQVPPTKLLTDAERGVLVAALPTELQGVSDVQPTLIAQSDVWPDGGLNVGEIIWGILVLLAVAGTELGKLIQSAIEAATEWHENNAYVRVWRVVGQTEMQSIWNSNYREYGISNNSTEKRFWISRAQALDYEHRMAQGANRGRATFLTSIRLRMECVPLMHWDRVIDTPILGGVYCSIDLGNAVQRAAFPYYYMNQRIDYHGQLRQWDMDQISQRPPPGMTSATV